MSVSCDCRELSGSGLCEGLIPRPEEFYRVRVCVCVIKCDQMQKWPFAPATSRQKRSD